MTKARHYSKSWPKMKAILVLLCIGLLSPPLSANPQFGVTFPDGKPFHFFFFKLKLGNFVDNLLVCQPEVFSAFLLV